MSANIERKNVSALKLIYYKGPQMAAKENLARRLSRIHYYADATLGEAEVYKARRLIEKHLRPVIEY